MFESYFTQNMREGEEVIAVVHGHRIGALWAILPGLILAILPFFLLKYLLSNQIAALIWLIIEVVALGIALYRWLTWYLDALVLTSERIIDIEQNSLFRRKVSETALQKVQDISFTVPGFFGTLLNYGTIEINTASDRTLALHRVPNPQKLQEVLADLVKIAHTKDPKMTAEQLVATIAKMQNAPAGAEGSTEDREDAAE